MRISDWSSDVCSSDLRQRAGRQRLISAMAGASSAVAVLGAGSWGTALAALIARHGHRTVLWGRDAAIVEAIDRKSVVLGKSVSVRVDLGGRRIITKKKKTTQDI